MHKNEIDLAFESENIGKVEIDQFQNSKERIAVWDS